VCIIPSNDNNKIEMMFSDHLWYSEQIADFGFSARFAMGDSEGSSQSEKDGWDGNEQSSSSFQTSKLPFATPPGHMTSTSLPDESLLRVLKSVVGSPFYVAPEVLQARGYDGPKADVWSLGVILYAMLAGNLPFEQELSSCKRFRLFCKWVREQTVKGVRFWNDQSLEYPQWLFPAKFSMLAKGLIVAMLHPDPDKRVSVSEAMRHPLCVSHFLSEAAAMPTVAAPSLVTFSLLPVAVAAAANVPNNTAIFQSNQIFDSDAWSIPIASAVVTISNSVPIAMANSREPSQQSQAQPMIPQGQVHSDDKHPLAMDVENDEEERCLTSLSEGNDLEDQANRSRTNAEDRSPRCSDMRHSHSGEHDDLDDGMFYMEEESVCSQRDESNSKSRNNDFSSISDNQPTLTSTSTSLDWNVLRKKSPNIPFPVTRDNTDRNRIDTTPGTSSGVFRDPYLVSQGDIFRDTNRSILSNTNGDAPGFSTTGSFNNPLLIDLLFILIKLDCSSIQCINDLSLHLITNILFSFLLYA
jgi:serine/threonine protein kinase